MLALFLALVFPLCAHAQFGVYGEFNGAIDASSFRDPTGMYGATVGGYFNLARVGPLVPGLDARGVFLNGRTCCSNRFYLRSFLAGPRVSFRLRKGTIKPYAEFLVGGGTTVDTLEGDLDKTGFTWQPVGGVDVALIPRLDWRVIEVSYQRSPDQYPGQYAVNPQTGILSTGIVFHF
jgi:hypothetical protein